MSHAAHHRGSETDNAALGSRSGSKSALRWIIQGGFIAVLFGAVGLIAFTSTGTVGARHADTTASNDAALLPVDPAGKITPARFTLEPRTLDELLDIAPDDLGKVDIARMNLLCAAGVAGAEYLTAEAIDAALATVDSWVPRVRFETERHLYRAHSQDPQYHDLFAGSEAKLRAYMLVQVLQEDLGIKYDATADGNFSFKDSSVAFLHGMIPRKGQSFADTKGGTCASMPVLYVAMGRRLGYPLKLVTTNAHVFARWEGTDHPDSSLRGRFNVDGAGYGISFHPDEYYKTWPRQTTDAEIAANEYLQSLTPADEFAQFLAARGHVAYDNNQYSFAARCYENAYRYDPDKALYPQWFALAISRDPSYQAATDTLQPILQQARLRASTRRSSPTNAPPPLPQPSPFKPAAPFFPDTPLNPPSPGPMP